MQSLSQRLNLHFLRCGALAGAAACAAAATSARATIVYSGPVNINIPSTTAGVYLNVASGVHSSNPALVAGWDVNLWGASGLLAFTPTPNPGGGSYVSTTAGGTTLANVPLGSFIGPASDWGAVGSLNALGGGFMFNSSSNLVGFRFLNELNGNQVHYGWMRLSLGNGLAAQPRSIIEYFWETEPGVGIYAVLTPPPPAPGTLASLALALFIRRRRRQ